MDPEAYAQWSATLAGTRLCLTIELTIDGATYASGVTASGRDSGSWFDAWYASDYFSRMYDGRVDATSPFEIVLDGGDCDASVSLVATGELTYASYVGCYGVQWTGYRIEGTVDLTAPDQPVLSTRFIDTVEPPYTIHDCTYSKLGTVEDWLDLRMQYSLIYLGLIPGCRKLNGFYYSCADEKWDVQPTVERGT